LVEKGVLGRKEVVDVWEVWIWSEVVYEVTELCWTGKRQNEEEITLFIFVFGTGWDLVVCLIYNRVLEPPCLSIRAAYGGYEVVDPCQGVFRLHYHEDHLSTIQQHLAKKYDMHYYCAPSIASPP
jgi:hypothetical protein